MFLKSLDRMRRSGEGSLIQVSPMAADGRDSPSKPLDGFQVARDIVLDVREPKAGEPKLWKPLGGARSGGDHRRSFSIGSGRCRPGPGSS
ncbi:hypothetical protein M5K25_006902 [Dendrobium thyrsiflorum]|uniref:Uncharacterized protein n=1 Tax=Dendrobium thyrsiflorum TaxID=117978 RepID=A0ABD0VCU3_DENTH